MIDYPNLIPECNIDTLFVEMLGYKKPNHAPSITIVSSILEKKTNQRAMGFVDSDKRQPLYFKEFKVIDTTANAKLLKHPERHHYLVVVNPDMDTFIFNLCRKLGINIADYNFPSDFKAFVSFVKKNAIRSNPNFKNLLNTILQKNPAEITKIKHWVTQYSLY